MCVLPHVYVVNFCVIPFFIGQIIDLKIITASICMCVGMSLVFVFPISSFHPVVPESQRVLSFILKHDLGS